MAASAALSLLDGPEAPTPTRNPNRVLSSAERLRKMRAGKQRADAQRRRESVKRVRAYKAWLVKTRDWPAARAFACVPGIPSDHDYRIARGDA